MNNYKTLFISTTILAGFIFSFSLCFKPETIKHNLNTGVDEIEELAALVKGKRVGLMVNHNAVAKHQHLADKLLKIRN